MCFSPETEADCRATSLQQRRRRQGLQHSGSGGQGRGRAEEGSGILWKSSGKGREQWRISVSSVWAASGAVVKPYKDEQGSWVKVQVLENMVVTLYTPAFGFTGICFRTGFCWFLNVPSVEVTRLWRTSEEQPGGDKHNNPSISVNSGPAKVW